MRKFPFCERFTFEEERHIVLLAVIFLFIFHVHTNFKQEHITPEPLSVLINDNSVVTPFSREKISM